jgi:lysophospholipase L1-like esterase
MPSSKVPSRRKFLQQASFLGAAVVAAPAMLTASPSAATGKVADGYTFLFQGDSITDGNRSRNLDWNHVLGHGYAYLIAARLWYDLPEKGYHFFNRGISGNKVTDLAQRWQDDTIAIKPDLLSILVGVNDVNAAISGDKNFTVASYEKDYRALLIQTQKQLPATQIVICEPFILPVGRVKDNWDKWQQEITGRQQVAKKLADEFGLIYVPLQDTFNQALKKAPADYWIWDGIHPMPGGHELMALEWIKVVNKKVRIS